MVDAIVVGVAGIAVPVAHEDCRRPHRQVVVEVEDAVDLGIEIVARNLRQPGVQFPQRGLVGRVVTLPQPVAGIGVEFFLEAGLLTDVTTVVPFVEHALPGVEMPGEEAPVDGFDVEIQAPEFVVYVDAGRCCARDGNAQLPEEIVTDAFMGIARILDLVVERELLQALVLAGFGTAFDGRVVPGQVRLECSLIIQRSR